MNDQPVKTHVTDAAFYSHDLVADIPGFSRESPHVHRKVSRHDNPANLKVLEAPQNCSCYTVQRVSGVMKFVRRNMPGKADQPRFFVPG